MTVRAAGSFSYKYMTLHEDSIRFEEQLNTTGWDWSFLDKHLFWF